ncbi:MULTISPECIES: RNA polymerase sigma factor [unclassified Aeromicrobium]|uniref:RNA polymerase sigma factor n=1 Tax=unclassified Aeromicrobium TaxID=2633570 RepID=UPI00288C09D7|nr:MULTISPECIES: RNA polymerase sigma factor [unclassified Aeromicrobium]
MTEEEFGDLYAALQTVVYRYAARRVGPERAKDITSDTFALAWEKRHEYPADNSAWPAWTVGIARNKVLQEIQKRERKHHDHRFVDDWLQPSAEPSVEDFSRGVLESDQARRIFAALTPAEQDLFGIAFIRDLTPSDGAAVLGISTSAYTTRVGRLRQRLRALDIGVNKPAITQRSKTR